MAKIPSSADLVNQRPGMRPAYATKAAQPFSVPNFGAEAEGTLQLARQLGSAAENIATGNIREQDRADDLRVEDAFNKLREKQLNLTLGQDEGFANIKGGDAVSRPILGEYGQKFDDTAKQLGEGLANDRQRERFNMRVGVARQSFVGDIMKHVNHEQNVFGEQVFKGTVDLETRSAMANWNDPDALGLSHTRIDAAVKNEIQRRGWKPEDPQSQALMMHATSGMHAAVINQALQEDDPEYAQTYFDAVKDKMDPTVVKTIGHQVAEGVQKQVSNEFQSRYLDVKDDPKQLSALEADVAKAGNLDDARKNIILGRVQNRIELLAIREQRDQDKKERLLKAKIDGVNKITLAGFEPSTEQMLGLLGEAKGTVLEGDVQNMIVTANATKQFRLGTPQQQEATISALEVAARKDPTKFDVTVIERFKSIYKNQQQDLKNDPTTFAIRQGLLKPDDAAAKPIDFSDPTKIGEQLQARFSLGRSMAARYQAPLKPLTTEEKDVVVAALRGGTAEQKGTFLAQLVVASGQDLDGYKAMMAQVAPDDPVTAHAGVMAGRGRISTDAGMEAEPGKATNVSQLILRGQAVLHPNRKEDGSPEKGKLWPMPKDTDFDKTFQGYERDAFANRPETRNGFMQTAKAIYAAKSVEAGDSSGILDNDRWEDSMKLATGGIERWNGKSIVMPWGYSKGFFKDELYRRIDDTVDRGQVPAEMRGKLRDMALESIGDGRYVFRSGDGVMTYTQKGEQPRPIIVDFNVPAAYRFQGKPKPEPDAYTKALRATTFGGGQ